MPVRRDPNFPKRNEACPCGSGAKFKRCHGFNAGREAAPAGKPVYYLDSGESAVRYVISNSSGTGFFADVNNRLLVFTDKATAFAVASLDEFSSQEPGEINVAGVGETKFKHLCETLPYVEVTDVAHAIALVRGRIIARSAELETNTGTEGQTDGNQKEEISAQRGEDRTSPEEADQGAKAQA